MPIRSEPQRPLGTSPRPSLLSGVIDVQAFKPLKSEASERQPSKFRPKFEAPTQARTSSSSAFLEAMRLRTANVVDPSLEAATGDPTSSPIPTFGVSGTGLDLPDPPLRDKEKGKFDLARFTGPLFVDGPSAKDVSQGRIGDCYFMATLAAVAHTDPKQIENVIKDNGDGTYTVRFFEQGSHKAVTKKIDGDLWVRENGSPLYAFTADKKKQKSKMELWAALIQKGYAAWKGSFHATGHGGKKTQVLEELYGKKAKLAIIPNNTDNQIWNTLKANFSKGWTSVAGTYTKTRPESKRYKGVKLSPSHSYSVLGIKEQHGKRYVRLRNPWGHTEPGSDGKNDGIFDLELKDFMHYFNDLAWIPTNSKTHGS